MVNGTYGCQCELATEVSFWRRCAQELIHDQTNGQQTAHSPPSAVLLELRQHSQQLSGEIEASQRNYNDLNVRLLEVEKITETAHTQSDQLNLHNEVLSNKIASVASATAQARARAALEWEEQQVLKKEIAALEKQTPVELHLDDGENAEFAFLAQRLKERELEVASLEQEHSRLDRALQRHTSHSAAVVTSEDGKSGWGAIDNTVTAVFTKLFKSVLGRRIFCMHLIVLYSWCFVLLTWVLNIKQQDSHRP